MKTAEPLLVLGANGQVGQALRQAAHHRGIVFVGLGRDEIDILDMDQISAAIARIRPKVVVNAAAYTAVDNAENHRVRAYAVNETGPANIAAACETVGVRMIHLSTDYVFDGRKSAPYVETDPINPIGVYGASKAAGEAAVRARLERHLIVRTAWVYGPFGNNFLKTMLRLSLERDQLNVVDDQVGNPTATSDVAEALLAAADRAATDEAAWGTYHFAGQGEATWFDFATAIVETAADQGGSRAVVRPIPTAQYPTLAKRPANSRLDSALFRARFGIEARPWRSRVQEVVAALTGGKA